MSLPAKSGFTCSTAVVEDAAAEESVLLMEDLLAKFSELVDATDSFNDTSFTYAPSSLSARDSLLTMSFLLLGGGLLTGLS